MDDGFVNPDRPAGWYEAIYPLGFFISFILFLIIGFNARPKGKALPDYLEWFLETAIYSGLWPVMIIVWCWVLTRNILRKVLTK